MSSFHYQWQLPKINRSAAGQISALTRQLHLPNYLIRLLIARGFKTVDQIRAFMHPQLSDLKNPFQIHDMKKGINRIKRAIRNHEPIIIYGDYDVDGITSTSIMYLLLKHFHANVGYFIPNRFRDGYGPNFHEYQKLVRKGTRLLITVDNGISGLKEITFARKHGMDVIITDHHDFPDRLPPANAIIMAAYPHHQYHFTDFCGAGIALKIAQAMLGRVPKQLLDLATLGTIADSVSLTSENRAIVKFGLRHLRHSSRPGIRALAKAAQIQLGQLTTVELSFTIIPRLNALGRMADANAGVALLTTNNSVKALDIAQMTEQLNRKRQTVMNKETNSALVQASSPDNLKRTTLVLADRNWFPGVVGIIASRIIDQYYKPTIVIGHLKADDQKHIDRGSGRSIPEFNLFKAMNPLRPTMTSFGGHPMACGLSIHPEKIQALRDGLEKAGRKAHLATVRPTIHLALRLAPQQISPAVFINLKKLAPFGQDNPVPSIDVRMPVLYNLRTMGQDNRHLSFTLSPRFGSVRAVAWQMGNLYPKLAKNPHNVELAGTLQINHYRGRKYLQFVVKHLRYYHPIILPTKRELGIIYRYLASKQILRYQSFTLDFIRPVGRYLHLNPAKITAATKIFYELQLIKSTPHTIKIVPHPKRHHLTESATYKTLLQQVPASH